MVKAHILIVEDEKNIREILVDILDFSGYSVSSASNGKEALNHILKKKVDAVICDIMMPEMDGYTFLSELRSKKEFQILPVVFLTAKVELEDKLIGLRQGVNDYITKPFVAKELVARLDNLLDNHNKVVENTLLEPHKVSEEGADQLFIRQVNLVIEEYISDSSLDLDKLTDSLNMSRSTLQKKLKRINSMSVSSYVREYRLKRAYALLKSGIGNISEVAFKTGFNSQSYFTESFKRLYGESPSQLLR